MSGGEDSQEVVPGTDPTLVRSPLVLAIVPAPGGEGGGGLGEDAVASSAKSSPAEEQVPETEVAESYSLPPLRLIRGREGSLSERCEDEDCREETAPEKCLSRNDGPYKSWRSSSLDVTAIRAGFLRTPREIPSPILAPELLRLLVGRGEPKKARACYSGEPDRPGGERYPGQWFDERFGARKADLRRMQQRWRQMDAGGFEKLPSEEEGDINIDRLLWPGREPTLAELAIKFGLRAPPPQKQEMEQDDKEEEEEEEEEEDACESAALIPTAPKRLRGRELERVKTMGAAKDGQNNVLVQTTPKQPPQAPVGWQSTNNSSLSRRQPSLAAPITFSKRLKKRQSLHNAASGRGGKGTRFFNRKRKLESNRPQRRSSANGTEAAAPSASISVTFEGSYSKRLFRPTPAAANARLTQSSLEDIFSQK